MFWRLLGCNVTWTNIYMYILKSIFKFHRKVDWVTIATVIKIKIYCPSITLSMFTSRICHKKWEHPVPKKYE